MSIGWRRRPHEARLEFLRIIAGALRLGASGYAGPALFSPESCSSSPGIVFAFTPESRSPCPGIRILVAATQDSPPGQRVQGARA
jgi:hypothetical protein